MFIAISLKAVKCLPLQKHLGQSLLGIQSPLGQVEYAWDAETLSLFLHAENGASVSAEIRMHNFTLLYRACATNTCWQEYRPQQNHTLESAHYSVPSIELHARRTLTSSSASPSWSITFSNFCCLWEKFDHDNALTAIKQHPNSTLLEQYDRQISNTCNYATHDFKFHCTATQTAAMLPHFSLLMLGNEVAIKVL